MGSEYMGSMPDPDTQKPSQSLPPSSSINGDAGRAHPEEPIYREHVSRPLVYGHPSSGPAPQYGGYPPARYNTPYPANRAPQTPPYGQQSWPSAYPPQASYPYPAQQSYYAGGYPSYNPGYNGYYGGYNPGGAVPYTYPPYRIGPKRDGYLLAISIIATVCSSLAILGGFFCGLLLTLSIIGSNTQSLGNTAAGQMFSGIALFAALTIVCLVGGSFSLYHSIRSLIKLRSKPLRLPRFWLFLIGYVVLLGIGFSVRGQPIASANTLPSLLYVGLAGFLPALAVVSFAVRRLRISEDAYRLTTWRRFTVALVSGATSAIFLALVLELILGVVVQLGLHVSAANLDNPAAQIPQDPRSILYLFIVSSIVAPLVEESCKPLAIVTLIGRINSAAEAFILGMACGIGFDLIETTGYISSGYTNWVDVALERSTSGLLHGVGAGMVALGWYYLSHPRSLKQKRILIGLGCGLYAVLQHATWNGSFLLDLIPGPIGNFLNNGQIMIGDYPLQAGLLVYFVISIGILSFLFFVTKKLRIQLLEQYKTPRSDDKPEQTPQPVYAQAQAYPASTPNDLYRYPYR